MPMNETLAAAISVLEALERNGFEAVFVGGCVRDVVLGRPLNDVDIATSATPEQVMCAFPKTIPTGLQHGTVTVAHGGSFYEVTTYRKESAYERHRKPAGVRFVTELEADLLRRDFTLNAMAMRRDGTIVDPFGGLRDIGARTLRCVGDADARFQEDALRMLRAVRFAAELELRIAKTTWRALKRHGKLLRHVAMERVGAEADKMAGGAHPAEAAAWLAVSGLLRHTKTPLPDRIMRAAEQFRMVRRLHAEPGLSSRIKGQFAAAERLRETDERWAAIAASLSCTPEEGAELFDAFRFSAARADRLTACARINLPLAAAVEKFRITGAEEQLRECWIDAVLNEGKAAAMQWLRVYFALHTEAAANRAEALLRDKLEAWLTAMPAASVKELAVRGNDIVARLRVPAGPWLGVLLNRLLRAAAFGNTANEREPLLQYAERLYFLGRSEKE